MSECHVMNLLKQTYELTPAEHIAYLYQRNVPRYTSYPTALEFSDDDYNTPLLANIANLTTPISLYIHIPFCHSLCYYCGCNKRVTRDNSKADEYLHYLGLEIAQIAQHNPEITISHIHYGGGSPSFLSIEQHTKLMHLLTSHFNLASECQMSIECDPRNLTLPYIQHLAKLGFTRMSLGVQDVDPIVQTTINRVQSSSHIQACIADAYHAGFSSINLDIIVGLPEQNLTTIQHTLSALAQFNVDRISVFNYAHLPERFAAQRKFSKHNMPAPELKQQMTYHIAQTLQSMGYQAIGMDHFAKPNDSLAVAANKGVLSRNFQGYTCDQNDQILGLGVRAISNISSIRAQNAVDLKRYYQQVTTESLRHKGRQLTQDDLIRGDLINQLMCNYTINLAAISQRWSIDADKYFAHEIDSLAFYSSLGIVTKHQQQYSISTQHKPLVRVIAQLFDQYKKDQTRFSSVI